MTPVKINKADSKSQSLRIQPKLTVGAANSPEEKEADMVAEKVMRMPSSAGFGGMAGNPNSGGSMAGAGNRSGNKSENQSGGKRPSSRRIYRKEEEKISKKQISISRLPIGNEKLNKKCETCSQDEKKIRRISSKSPPAGGEKEIQRKGGMSAITELVRQTGSGTDPPAQASDILSRKCANCEQEQKVQRQTIVQDEPEQPGMLIQTLGNATHADAPAPASVHSTINSTRGTGSRLPAHVSHDLGSKIGADFSGVNIHTGSHAVQMNRQLGARAFTVGSDIYFNSGEYKPGTHDGNKLLAHELTHTVQQGAVVRKSPEVKENSEEKVNRWSFGEWLADSAWSIFESIAPAELSVIVHEIYDKGIIGFLTDKIKDGLSSLFSAFPNVGGFVTNLITVFGDLYARVSGIMAALIAGDCAPLLQAVDELKNIITTVASDAWADLVNFVQPIGDFFSGLWTSYGAPVMDWLSQTAGDVWAWMQNIGTQLWEWTQPVRDWAGSAWDWLKGIIGIGTDSTGAENQNGLVQWISDKASEAWNGIKETLNPVIEPVMEIANKVIEILPLDAISNLRDTVVNYADSVNSMAAAMGPDAGGVADEASQASLRDTILPAVQNRIIQVREGLSATGLWISDKVGGFVTMIGGFYNSVLANPWLSFAAGAISWVNDTAVSLGGWVQDGVVSLFNSANEGLGYLATFIEPIFNALQRLIGTLRDLVGSMGDFILGPFMLIPECIRTPIKDFLLTQILARIPLFNQIMALPDIWNRAQEVAMLILYQVFVDGNLFGAMWTFFRELLGLIGIPPDLLVSILANASRAIGNILRDPVGFIINLVRALGQGFTQFFSNIGTHLLNGVVNWLTGQMQSIGIQPPADFSFGSIFSFILQILGITIDNIFRLLATRIGDERAQRLRRMLDMATGAWTFIRDVVERGPAAIWERIQEQLSNLWTSVITSITTFITERIVAQATIWLLGLLDISGIMPVVNTLIAIYRAINSFVEYFVPILNIINQYMGMLADVSSGNIDGAANFLEQLLANSLPIMIGFLASQFGFGSLAHRMSEILGAIRERIDNGILWVIDRAIAIGGAIMDMGRSAVSAVLNWWNARKDFNVEGEPHHLFFEGEGQNARLIVSSDPVHIGNFIAQRGRDLDAEPDSPAKTTKLNAMTRLVQLEQELRRYTNVGPTVGTGAGPGGTNRTSQNVLDEMSAQIQIIGFGASANRPVPRMLFGPGFNSNLTSGNHEIKFIYNDRNNHEPGDVPNVRTNLVPAFNHLVSVGLGTGSARWVRAHLLNHNIGGRATDSNLIPMAGAQNTTMESSFESPMWDAYSSSTKPVLWQDISITRNSTDNNFVDSFSAEWGYMDWNATTNQWAKRPGSPAGTYSAPAASIQKPMPVSTAGAQSINALRGGSVNALTISTFITQTNLFSNLAEAVLTLPLPGAGPNHITGINSITDLEKFITHHFSAEPRRMSNYISNARQAEGASRIKYV